MKEKQLTEHYVSLARKGIEAKVFDSSRCANMIAELQLLWIRSSGNVTEMQIARIVDRHVRAMDLAFAVRIGFKKYSEAEFKQEAEKKRKKDNNKILRTYDLEPKKVDNYFTHGNIDKQEEQSNVITGIDFRQKKDKL